MCLVVLKILQLWVGTYNCKIFNTTIVDSTFRLTVWHH